MTSLKRKLAVLLAVCMVVMNIAPAYAEGETEPKTDSTRVESVQESEDEIEIASPSVAEYKDAEDDAELEEEEATSSEAEYEEFFDEMTVDGVTITATAKAGVVPNGTKLSAEKVEDEDTEEAIDEVVEEKRGDKINVAESFKFDIKLILDGEEIQPKGKLNITFSMEEAVNDNAKIDVYHIIENKETDELVRAEELKVKTENKEEEEVTEFSVETTGFSYYVVEFTLNNLQYVLNGDESVKLSAILAELELEGTVTDAEVSNDKLFTVTKDEGGNDWTVTALKAFSSKEWMKVTINNQAYEIIVTDDAETYEIKYDKNTSDDVRYMPDNGIKTHGETYKIPISSNPPLRIGYRFMSWNTQADGKGTEYKPHDDYKDNAPVTFYAQWKAKTYEVRFNNNKGFGSMTPQRLTYDVAQKLSKNTFTREGYSFIGWNTNPYGTGKSYADEESVKNLSNGDAYVTLYAQWSGNQYTVTLDKNGGAGGPDSVTATYGRAMPKITPPSKAGYTFLFYETSGGTGDIEYYDYDGNSHQDWNIAKDTTLYAYYTVNDYTVAFDGNGQTSGSMGTQSFTYDADPKALAANNFARTNYTFIGWNTERDGTGTFYEDKAPVKNLISAGTVTLYAQWLGDSYTVTLEQDSATEKGDGSVTVRLDEIMPDLSKLPERTGYVFDGFYESADLTGTKYYDSEGKSSVKWETVGGATIHACWKKSLTLNMAPEVSVINTGSQLSESIFTGGKVTDLEGTEISGTFEWKSPETNATVSGAKEGYEVVFTPVNSAVYSTLGFTLNPFIRTHILITNDGHGTAWAKVGEEQTADLYELSGESVNLGKESSTGYSFDSWECTEGVSVTDDVLNIPQLDEVSVKAVFSGLSYPVTFTGNYTESSFNETVPETYGSKYTLPQTEPERPGYTFIGWYTDSEEGTRITKDITVTITAAQTLYAHWTKNAYSITVTTDGNGTAKANVTTALEGDTITLEALPSTGYEFDEWDSGITITNNRFIMPAKDVTVRALFKKTSTPDSDTDPKPDSKPDPKSDPKADSKTNSKPDPKLDPKLDPKHDSKESGSGSGRTLFTVTWGDPVSNGTWKYDAATNSWSYTTTEKFTSTWGYIVNPYATARQNTADWFYFDVYGNMLTGWQFIQGKWYYLNPTKNGTLGACLLGPGRTPDGYEIDASGAWTGR